MSEVILNGCDRGITLTSPVFLRSKASETERKPLVRYYPQALKFEIGFKN
jgi:hypothetical protein